MQRSLLIYLVAAISISGLTAFAKEKSKLIGNWKIQTVAVEGDTLYHAELIQHTVNFYNKRMAGWKKSEDDAQYIWKCMHSSYFNLKDVILEITKKDFTLSTIIPCWDHMRMDGVSNGNYQLTGDSITLLKTEILVLMKLKYEVELDQLFYSNDEYDYQIIYARDEASNK
jgi:hypothetical protein